MLGVHDVSNIYHVPLVLREQHAAENILSLLKLPCGACHLEKWEVGVTGWGDDRVWRSWWTA